MLCILSAVVVEQLVVGADLGINFIHVVLYDGRKGIIVRVAGLSRLEEDIRVLSGTSLAGMVRVQRLLTERSKGIPVHHFL